jgi:hypothetical protein
MDGSFDRQVLSRIPLADAVLSLFGWICEPGLLEAAYDAGRGRCHNRLLSFPLLVELIYECLLLGKGSARKTLVKAKEEKRLPVSLKAFYQKLGRMPVQVTMEFFRTSAQRLRAAVPAEFNGLPQSLRNFSVQLIDGKVIKHVPRRLLELRHNCVTAAKLLGGRALVAVNLADGLVQDLYVHPDGESNDVKYVPELLQSLRSQLTRLCLVVGDRAFGVFKVCEEARLGGHFLFRRHGQTKFEADPQRSVVKSIDRFGRPVTERWGWILRGKKDRMSVRLITVTRDKEKLDLITSLLSPETYPVGDLLDVYLDRWNIEQVFQKITEVFQLNALFSTHPEGMLFQLTFCLLMYNVIHLVKQYIAWHQQREEVTISTAMLFDDTRDELAVAFKVFTQPQLITAVPRFDTAVNLRNHLHAILGSCWQTRWIKANHRPRNPAKPITPKPEKMHQTKSHDSVYRILQRANQ